MSNTAHRSRFSRLTLALLGTFVMLSAQAQTYQLKQWVVNLQPTYRVTARWTVPSIALGGMSLNQTAQQEVTLFNDGNFAADFSTLTGSGSGSGITADASQCSAVAPGTSCSVVLTFTPTAMGPYEITALRPASVGSVAFEYTNTLSVSGTGLLGMASVSPSSLTFASQRTGESSPAQAVVVTNTGNDTLVFSSTGIAMGATDFGQSNDCASVLPGATCTTQVSFTPSATGTRTGALVFVHTGSGVTTVGLTGTGVPSCNGATALYSTAGWTAVTVPGGCATMTVKAWGAGGGSGTNQMANSGTGGGGGFATGAVPATPGTVVQVLVGGGGGAGVFNVGHGAGGFGGGGSGSWGDGNGGHAGAGGGGASGVLATRTPLNSNDIFVLAGGGGGSGTSSWSDSSGNGGGGGGAAGNNGTGTYIGYGGTTSAAGYVWQHNGIVPGGFFAGGGAAYRAGGGGGGGGLYGGGGAGINLYTSTGSGGGGGSGYTAANATGGLLVAASGGTAALATDPIYTASGTNAGNGATQGSNGNPGRNGLVAITWGP